MDDKNVMGVFTAALLKESVATGVIALSERPAVAQIQPSSLDLTLGQTAYRVRASFLPGKDKTVLERLDDGLMMHQLDLRQGAVLEKGCVYLVQLRETLALPDDVAAAANPKSSTGRIDVFVRMVTDYATLFETAVHGYKGALWVEISPKTFSILVREGSSLNQLRLRRGTAMLDDRALAALHQQTPLVSGAGHFKNGLGMTVQVQGQAGDVIGYRARRHAGLIDVDRLGALDPREYWEAIPAPQKGFIILDPDEFYILASREWCYIPPTMAAEMTPIDPLLGEFRVHYAGFFDPGFGAGGGSRAVLEVRGHDAPFILEDGQLVARLVYENLIGATDHLYGDGIASNYQGQGLKLSKHFGPWS